MSSTATPGTTAAATDSGACDGNQGGDGLGWLSGRRRHGGAGKRLRHGERERENWRSGFTDRRRWPRTCSPRRNSSARLGLPE
jgi:hypothetical protein